MAGGYCREHDYFFPQAGKCGVCYWRREAERLTQEIQARTEKESRTMQLDLQCLENFKSMVQHQGASVWFTVKQPDGSEKTIDINLVFLEVLDALKSIEHFLEMQSKPNPTGAKRIG